MSQAELLHVDLVFALEDKVNDDPILNLDCIKRGHVLHWEPVGDHRWTNYELTAPHWHIVTAKLPLSTLTALLTHDTGDGIKKHHRYRRYKLDINLLSAEHLLRPQDAVVDGQDLSIRHPRTGYYTLTEIKHASIVAAMKFIAAD